MDPCVKCGGFVHVDPSDEPRCLQCSFRPPLVPKVIQYRTEGGSQCTCGAKADMDDGVVCRACRYEGHAEKIKKGMQSRRICRTDTCDTLCEAGMFYCGSHRPKRYRTRKIGPVLPVVQS